MNQREGIDLIAKLKIGQTDLAKLSGVAPSQVTHYTKFMYLGPEKRSRIEDTLEKLNRLAALWPIPIAWHETGSVRTAPANLDSKPENVTPEFLGGHEPMRFSASIK